MVVEFGGAGTFAGWCLLEGCVCLFQVEGDGVVLLEFVPRGFRYVDGGCWGGRVWGGFGGDVGVYEVGCGGADVCGVWRAGPGYREGSCGGNLGVELDVDVSVLCCGVYI